MIKAKQVKVEVGTNPKKRKSDVIYFSSFDEMNKILTSGRLAIVEAIKEHNPESVYELAKVLGKDQANLNRDIKVLEEYGFVDVKKSKDGERVRSKPESDYDLIEMTIKLGAGVVGIAKDVLDEVGEEFKGDRAMENKKMVRDRIKRVKTRTKNDATRATRPIGKRLRKFSSNMARKIVDLSKEKD